MISYAAIQYVSRRVAPRPRPEILHKVVWTFLHQRLQHMPLLKGLGHDRRFVTQQELARKNSLQCLALAAQCLF